MADRVQSMKGIINSVTICACWEQHLERQQQRHYRLWDVLMLRAWPEGIDGR